MIDAEWVASTGRQWHGIERPADETAGFAAILGATDAGLEAASRALGFHDEPAGWLAAVDALAPDR